MRRGRKRAEVTLLFLELWAQESCWGEDPGAGGIHPLPPLHRWEDRGPAKGSDLSKVP